MPFYNGNIHTVLLYEYALAAVFANSWLANINQLAKEPHTAVFSIEKTFS